jgi:hypothetical protein
MAHDPLVLTAEQSALVAFTATSLPPRWRPRFKNAVADLLTLHPNPSNTEVTAAVSAAKRSICIGIGPPSMD